jgi:hypothetical protein
MVAGMHAEHSCRPREESLFITDSPYEALGTVCGWTRRLAAHRTCASTTRQPRFRPEVRRIMRGRHQGTVGRIRGCRYWFWYEVLRRHKEAINHVVSERNQTTHPHSLPLGGGDLVADPFGGYLTFELREGQQDVKRQASIDVVVLNCWVTATKETPRASNTSTIFAKSVSDRVSRSTL